jgi:photosystem II stability/assembly factor-like uncharacterized protein
VSLPRKRLAATLAAITAFAWAGIAVFAVSLAPSTWVQLPPMPQAGNSAILAIAVNPLNNQVVIAGTAQGSLMRSSDGGLSWAVAHAGSSGLLTIAYSPVKTGLVLAGTRGSGALVSNNGGATWAAVKGLEGRSVRAFGFALTFMAAGTDHGVYVSADGLSWRQSGLATVSIGSLAVAAIHDPARLVAGSDAASPIGGIPLFQSTDGGTTWARMSPPISGKVVSSIAAGPLPPANLTRPLIVGTNAGLFTSRDNGTTFTANSGGGLLPSTDYTQVAFVTTHFDRFYTASDGGGSASGGLWKTIDAGKHFTSLAPPMPSVTGLAVSNDESPILYVATFRPADQTPVLWAYRDTGGAPQGPPSTPTPSASGPRTSTPGPAAPSGISQFLGSSQTPYIAIGLAALVVILLAVVAHFRGRRG